MAVIAVIGKEKSPRKLAGNRAIARLGGRKTKLRANGFRKKFGFDGGIWRHQRTNVGTQNFNATKQRILKHKQR